jgi:hypothetical protein
LKNTVSGIAQKNCKELCFSKVELILLSRSRTRDLFY